MVSTRALEVFITVYEEGSMTGAGRRIHMSQPAVSQTIREIEDEYGTELFERYGSKLHVTQAGQIFYEHAKRIMNLYDDLDEAIRLNEGVREIRVGCNISAGTAQIMPILDRFAEIYPDINVKVMVFQAPVLLKALQNNDLDVALVEDQRKGKAYGELISIPYYKDRIIVAAPSDHKYAGKKVALTDLKDEQFLFRERGAGVRDMFDHILSLRNFSVNIAWECTSTDAIVRAIQKHMGIAVLPYLLVKNYLDEGTISEIELEDVSLSRNLNIVYHKDKVFTKPLDDFVGVVNELFAQKMD